MKNRGVLVTLCFTFCPSVIAEWPFGTYTLVKPKSGCPSGWQEGWRRQDSEDGRNRNSLSFGHHIYGSFGRNLKFYYCTLNPNMFSGRRYWPSGKNWGLRLVVFIGTMRTGTTKTGMVVYYQVVTLDETPE
uniref:Uncharacterized protein LOC111106039 n=1 Tax=Crassostrea virginica TaxID=6565 RepID=A0A8B8AZS0_CRAVI|nr:uncharacterized protein LOC111106039 [Crassostrea virginica]